MKILVLASDKGGKFAPFIEEQITALQQAGVEVILIGCDRDEASCKAYLKKYTLKTWGTFLGLVLAFGLILFFFGEVIFAYLVNY